MVVKFELNTWDGPALHGFVCEEHTPFELLPLHCKWIADKYPSGVDIVSVSHDGESKGTSYAEMVDALIRCIYEETFA